MRSQKVVRLNVSRPSGLKGLLLPFWLVVLLAGCDRVGEKPARPVSATTGTSTTNQAPEEQPSSPPRSSKIALNFTSRGVAGGATESSRFNHPAFADVAAATGIDHHYENGAAGKLLMVEAIGGGAGWIDFDRDGQWDLYLNQGGDPVDSSSAARPSDQLFRNRGEGRFEPATIPAAIDERGYSQGLAIGDFDNDGFDDVFVTNVGGNRLFHNTGDGTFRDVTPLADVMGGLWSTSAAWGDLDLDGDLDLYVCNYVDFDPLHPIECRNSKGMKIMCEPNNHVDPVPDECYLNLGDGTFRPVARERGLFGPGNKSLGVAIADFNNDDWPDVLVANDTTANFLFINQHDGTFVDQAQLLGCAVAADGQAQANMGIAIGDYDRNGWLDPFITHFEGEWNTLYRNHGPAGFQDVSAAVGLVPPRMDRVGFGTVMVDFNQDGQDELFVANGHLSDSKQLGVPLEMPQQCFTFDGTRWHDCSLQAGPYFAGRYVGRGVATADFDNDGDVDLAVVHQNQPAALLRNDSKRGHWLKLQFTGRRTNRNGIGVRAVVRQGAHTLMQELAGGTSYCAANQPMLAFGLGESDIPCRVEIHWPAAGRQVLEGVRIDQALQLLEPLRGTDEPAPVSPLAVELHE